MVRIDPPTVPSLVVGTVSHRRRTPVRHAFEHAHYQWLVDLDALPRQRWPLKLLARFDDRDHLDGGRLGGGTRGDLERWLSRHGVVLDPRDRVLMLAHARALGHVFDPLTVYWCVRPDDSLLALVLEVHNTYGERHAYLLDVDDNGRAEVGKAFYVSPFNDTHGRYAVAVEMDTERVRASVGLDRCGERILTAVTSGRPVPATTPTVLRVFGRHLFMTHRVSLLIRWHGIRLWLAGLPRQPRPRHPQEAVR
jgi:uncharacterized protein